MNQGSENALVIECAGDRMVGIVHQGFETAKVGVLVVVGGPQYRVGSHRQFVLLARQLAAAGIPVLRYDYRGMGDSEGTHLEFDEVDADITSALDDFQSSHPGLAKIVVLGLCDAASAALIYATADSRVGGLVLLNPWVRTVQGEAKSYLRYYYFSRLLQKSFWRKVLSGQFNPFKSISGFAGSVVSASGDRNKSSDVSEPGKESFILRMLRGFERFDRPVLFLISGRDLVAREFLDLCREDRRWKTGLRRESITVSNFAQADHTMSGSTDLLAAGNTIIEWARQNFDIEGDA